MVGASRPCRYVAGVWLEYGVNFVSVLFEMKPKGVGVVVVWCLDGCWAVIELTLMLSAHP